MGLKTRVSRLEAAARQEQPEDTVIRVCDRVCTCEECELVPVDLFPADSPDTGSIRVAICGPREEVGCGTEEAS